MPLRAHPEWCPFLGDGPAPNHRTGCCIVGEHSQVTALGDNAVSRNTCSYRGRPVRDDELRAAAGQPSDGIHDRRLGVDIESRCRLIEDKDRAVAQQGARNPQALLFPFGGSGARADRREIMQRGQRAGAELNDNDCNTGKAKQSEATNRSAWHTPRAGRQRHRR